KRRRGWIRMIVYVVLVLGIGVLLGTLGWNWAADLMGFGKSDVNIEVTLSEDYFDIQTEEVEDLDSSGKPYTYEETTYVVDVDYVADLLESKGLIKYDWLFKLFVNMTDSSGKMRPGTYVLNGTLDYRAMISSMGTTTENRTTVDVTFIEGSTEDQVFDLLVENEVCTLEDLQDTAANYDFDYYFLADEALGDYHRLEGFLFPDTYEFYVGDSAENVLDKMLEQFNNSFTEEMREQVETMGYSMHDIVTIASIIEKETSGIDRADIASVIYNRLERPNDETLGFLNMDCTIYYVTGRTVTTEDYTEVDSPYNTYLYTGLPPGPIANPGFDSLYAAVFPNDTSYYFYTLNPESGTHEFSVTYAEHLAKVRRYSG
ncbi:MAG: endolytic transglycosylase MltG, partial [Oscillospiraceae bacterium]|nr:endolytic transglycosylase MltG [Oscillospiraceae bacterium]